jgi:hypothetical protein
MRTDLVLDAREMGTWTRHARGPRPVEPDPPRRPRSPTSSDPLRRTARRSRGERVGRLQGRKLRQRPRGGGELDFRSRTDPKPDCGAASGTSRLRRSSTPAGSSTDGSTANSAWSTRRLRTRPPPAPPRFDYRRSGTTEPPLNPGRNTFGCPSRGCLVLALSDASPASRCAASLAPDCRSRLLERSVSAPGSVGHRVSHVLAQIGRLA